MTLHLPSRRPCGAGSRPLHLALFAAALSLAVSCACAARAQRPLALSDNNSLSAATPAHAPTPPSAHADPRSGIANIPTPQPHLRSHIGLNLGLGGRWWDDAANIRQLRLSPDQQRRMDTIFEANKPALMSLYLNMQREQARLSSLPPSDLQDQAKVFAAIDRVSQARCDLEKENARILIQIRHQLDHQQLQTLDREIASLQ